LTVVCIYPPLEDSDRPIEPLSSCQDPARWHDPSCLICPCPDHRRFNMARHISKAPPQVNERRQSCRMIRTHPPLGVVILIGNARPLDVRHNRPIGRETTVSLSGANLAPQQANHIHVSLGDEARSVIISSCQLLLHGCVRLNSPSDHTGSA
jgi:hypothetical protein